jgi:outer membrane protein assembly factor BamB
VYLATTAGQVVALDIATLTARWTVSAGDVVYGAPALARDTLYVLPRNGVLLSIPVAAPETARRDSLLIVAVAGPTPLAHGVLVAGVDGTLLLSDRGAVRWRIRVPGPVESPPIVQGGALLVVGGQGDVHLFR